MHSGETNTAVLPERILLVGEIGPLVPDSVGERLVGPGAP